MRHGQRRPRCVEGALQLASFNQSIQVYYTHINLPINPNIFNRLIQTTQVYFSRTDQPINPNTLSSHQSINQSNENLISNQINSIILHSHQSHPHPINPNILDSHQPINLMHRRHGQRRPCCVQRALQLASVAHPHEDAHLRHHHCQRPLLWQRPLQGPQDGMCAYCVVVDLSKVPKMVCVRFLLLTSFFGIKLETENHRWNRSSWN